MKKYAIAAFLAIFALSAQAETLKVMETVKISAPPAKVWEKIGHFADITWHPAVKSSDASDGDHVGSVRRLDVGGPILWGSLVAYKPMSYSYRVLDNGSNQKVLPVSHYLATIVVTPDGQGSEVTWSSTFEPAPGAEVETAQKAVVGLYRTGLDSLAKGFSTN
jgi:Polyketide cyclase / dehydrase and lipid transport